MACRDVYHTIVPAEEVVGAGPTPVELLQFAAFAAVVTAAPEERHALPLAELPLSRLRDFPTRTALVEPTLQMAIAIARQAPATIATLKRPMLALLRSSHTRSFKQRSGPLERQTSVIETVEDFAGGSAVEFRKVFGCPAAP